MDRKKYILVLGGTGFLGTNILDFYNKVVIKGSDEEIVFVVVGKTNAIQIKSNSIYSQIDFTDGQELRKLMKQHKFEEVFHFISTSVPATSNLNIKQDVEFNLLSTLTLLELMKEFGIKKLTYLSSGGTVYGEQNEKIYQEDYLSSPNNSYGVLKLTIENYIKLYNKLFGINYLILRVSNPFGLFHNNKKNGLINIAIRKSIKLEPISIWGDGNATKDYIFATDFAKIFWELKGMNVFNEIINVGSGQSYSINDIIGFIKLVIPTTRCIYQDEKNFDTKNSDFKIDKLNSKLNIKTTQIQEAIENTYIWEKRKLK